MAPLMLGVLLLPFAGAWRLRRQGRRLHRLLIALLMLGGMATVASITGCGSANGFFAQHQQNYDVTVTATAGGLQHSASRDPAGPVALKEIKECAFDLVVCSFWERWQQLHWWRRARPHLPQGALRLR